MQLFKTLNFSFIKKPYLWLMALFISSSFHVHAHPHSWIELKTVIEGEDGVINGLTMEWSFDAMTSAMCWMAKIYHLSVLKRPSKTSQRH
ncbi:hypothetical protein JCM19233_1234 [Vibrio astriarenae]|nr:hypothetical protein JCM19233_1234 [Vibrio sp. C7]